MITDHSNLWAGLLLLVSIALSCPSAFAQPSEPEEGDRGALSTAPLPSTELEERCPEPAATPEARAQESLQYADLLLAQGEHFRAVGEYMRASFLDPSERTTRNAELGIALSYQLADQHELAMERYGLSQDLVPEHARAHRDLNLSISLYHLGRHEDLHATLLPWLQEGALTPQQKALAMLYTSLSWVAQGEHSLARAALSTHEQICQDPNDSESCSFLSRNAEQLETPPERYSAWLSLSLSTLIPGAGQVYSGYTFDGLYYLGTTSLLTYLSYETYQHQVGFDEQGAPFYILGSLALSTYLSNLLGAYTSALRRNQVEEIRYRESLEAGPLPGPTPIQLTP